MNEFVSQATSATMVVYALRLLQHWFPRLATSSNEIKVLLSACGAALSAAGIHYTFALDEGTLIVTGLTTTSLIHGVGHLLQQFAGQQLLYDLTKGKT